MAGRPIKKRTCALPVSIRAMPENEIPPARRVDLYLLEQEIVENKNVKTVDNFQKTLYNKIGRK